MNYVNAKVLKEIVKSALKEDIGRKDITTDSIVPAKRRVKAIFLAKEDCVVCGLGIASLTFRMLDRNIKFKLLAREGDFIKKGKVIARITGKARSILTAERVALNFLTLLSGVSTATRKFVNAVKPYKAKIIDTRKTIPGLRVLQKYAVRIGGGFNHRLSLDEMILVKDNHLKIINPKSQIPKLKDTIERMKKDTYKSIKIEVEVKNLKEFKEVLKLKLDIIMLDNMSVEDMKKAVQIRNSLSPKPRSSIPRLEASGGIALDNVRKVASIGVDMISVGALTHSVKSADISLEIL